MQNDKEPLKAKLLRDVWQACALALIAFFLGSLVMPTTLAALGKDPDGKFETVDIEIVRSASQTGNPVLLDARNTLSFSVAHIPGATSLRHNSPEAQIKEAAKNPVIIAYCSEPTCPDSKKLAARLVKAGAKKVLLYPGGWEEWAAAEGLK